MTLTATGTRGLLGATLGATLGASAGDRDEPTLAWRLLRLLEPGMLVLLDRAFDANAFLADLAGFADIAAPGRCCWPAPSPRATRPCCSTCRTVPTCPTWTV
jgi:hypothetical protein